MLLVWLLLVVGAPDLAALGADDWHLRERETNRCDNFLFALLLPDRHADPEVDYRVKQLKRKNLRWLNPRYIEQVIHRDDFAAWVKWYLTRPGRTTLELVEVLDGIQRDPQKRETLLALLPLQPGENNGFLQPSMVPTDLPRFLDYLDYHWHPAPMPREKRP